MDMKRWIHILIGLCIGWLPLSLYAQGKVEGNPMDREEIKVDLDSLLLTLSDMLSWPVDSAMHSAYIQLTLDVGDELIAAGDCVTTSELIELLEQFSLSEEEGARLGKLRATTHCEALYQSLAKGDTLFYGFHQAVDALPQYDEEVDSGVIAYLHAIGYQKEAGWWEGHGQLEEALRCKKEELALYEAIQEQELIWPTAAHVAQCLIDLNRVEEGYELITTYLHSADLQWEEIPYAAALFQRVVLANNLGKVTDLADIDQEIDYQLNECKDRQALFYLYLAKGWLYAHLYRNDYLAIQWYLKNQEWMDSNAETIPVSMRKLHDEALLEVYLNMGDFEQALVYGLKDAELIEPDNKHDWVYIQSKIIEIHMQLGQEQQAKETLSGLMGWCAQQLDPSDELYLSVWDQWLLFCHRTGDWAGFTESAKKVIISFTPDQMGSSSSYFNFLMWIYYETADVNEEINELVAEKLKDWMDGAPALNERDWIDGHLFLADQSMRHENTQEAIVHYQQYMTLLKEELRRGTLYLNRQARERSSEQIFHALSLVNSVESNTSIDSLNVSPFTEIALNVSLLSKGYLLQTEQSIRDLIQRKGSSDDWTLYQAIEEKQALLSRYQADSVRYATELFETQGWLDRASAELLRRCNAYGDIASFLDMDYQWVKAQLGQHEYLVDFTAEESRWKAIPYLTYRAYIVDKEAEYPLQVNLFMDKKVGEEEEYWADEFYQLPDTASHSYYGAVSRFLVDMFRMFVPGSTIYYIPTYLFYKIDLSSIPLEDGSLLGDHYRFMRISSANELRKRQGLLAADSLGRAVMFGGLNYDLDEEEWMTAAVRYSKEGTFALRRSAIRGSERLVPLPGTAVEVKKIGALMQKKGWSVEQFSGSVGTAEAFLALDGHAPKLLHIATHGFYYDPKEGDNKPLFAGLKDAMALSGLAFAGANAAWSNKPIPQGVHNGIVTAQEIAKMDLSGLELVVLSACETGEGKTTDEGIYGLQRAFKKAGAGTIVMSLWPVSDRVTQEFMQLFYQGLLDPALNGDKLLAFNRAKGAIRAKYEEPVYWAGFVMMD